MLFRSIRTHPVTGRKCIYLNKMFAHGILDFNKHESDLFVNFIDDKVSRAADLQCRIHHEKGTVVLWDNRNTAHSACMDNRDSERRHVARITPMAEVPYGTPYVEQKRLNIERGEL